LQPPGYLSALAEISRRHGALLVCDEVATGFGRTGRMFAVEHAGVEPNILCLGKGITGGYLPLAATLASEEIFTAFLAPRESFEAFFHGHTYTGNPLACAVALASLALFESEQVITRVQQTASFLASLLQERCASLRAVGDIRQCGLMVGIELVREGREAYAPSERIGHRTIMEARRRGVILRPLGNVIVLMPPLSITGAEIDRLAAVTAESIDSATSTAAARAAG